MTGPQTAVAAFASSGATALQFGIPGTQELIIIFLILITLGLPVLAVIGVVYVLTQRSGTSDEVERLENRVEELEAKLDEE